MEQAELHRQRANRWWLLHGDLSAAVEEYQQAIRHNDEDASLWSALGFLQYELGDLDAALTSLTRALAIDPDFVEARHNRGILKRELGDLEGAQEDADEVVRAQPSAENIQHRAGLREAAGRLDEALHDYERVLELNPTPLARLRCAVLLYKLGQGEACTGHLQIVEDADPRLEKGSGDWTAAYNQFIGPLRSFDFGDDGAALLVRARLLAALGEMRQARKDLEKAVKLGEPAAAEELAALDGSTANNP